MKPDKIDSAISYTDTGTWLHRLNGVTKFLCFLAWISAVLMTFDIRIIGAMIALGLWLLRETGVPFRVYRPLLIATLTVLLVNAGFMFLIAPGQGPALLGSETVLLSLGRYSVSAETLYYLVTVTLKYFSMFPIALVFVFCTHPTEFAASLNRLGLPYRIAYAVSLTLRYLPAIKQDFLNILHAQQARGVDISADVSLPRRLRNLANLLGPLLFSSLGRADTVANAMVLRGFGRHSRRTWYRARPLAGQDYLLIVLALVLLGTVLAAGWGESQRFWLPRGA